MRMYDIIAKKRDGLALTKQELSFFIEQYTAGNLPDYQASALLMAIYLRGMSQEETANLTAAMAQSGDTVDLSGIEGIKVDKHSTGGVGDKTTLIVAPIVAACGLKMAKMSGRGLGHTGGTLDKLESVPGYQVAISPQQFVKQVNEIGLAVIGQSGDVAPADKKLYALRDVTATVSSIPLIASSIMSKKLAAGADCILLDVKVGSGAFMKTKQEAELLAQEMISIGNAHGKHTAALLTNMDLPLGYHVGNSLEVMEAVQTLQGNGPEDLNIVCKELACRLLFLAGTEDLAACRQKVESVIADGTALEKLRQMVQAQGGDVRVIDDVSRFPKATMEAQVLARQDGFLSHMDAEKIGIAASILGAGRETKDAPINPAAGLRMLKKTGDSVKKGDVLANLYTDQHESLAAAQEMYESALRFSLQKTKEEPLVIAYLDAAENR